MRRGNLVELTGKGERALTILGFDEDYRAGRKFKPSAGDVFLILEPPKKVTDYYECFPEYQVKVLWGTKVKSFLISYASGEDNTDYFKIIR